MDFQTVADAILTGKFDDRLESLVEIIKRRRAAKGTVLFYDVQPGDRVRISMTARPKYIQGAIAVVRERRHTRVVVDLEQPVGRFHRGIVCPPEMLTKVA